MEKENISADFPFESKFIEVNGSKMHYVEEKIIRFGILAFWTIFWLLNVIDKFISGYGFLWVGKDRFAQISKFFMSLGLINHSYAIAALIIITALEIIAFILMAAALLRFIQNNEKRARTLFFYASATGLVIFSFFSIGDQIFGDRFELLEHTIFWIAIIVSWGAYTMFPKVAKIKKLNELWINYTKEALVITVISLLMIVLVVMTIIVSSKGSIEQQRQVVVPIELGEGVYSFHIPFVATRTVWEKSLAQFMSEHKNLRITDIQEIPSGLKSKKDNVIFFVITEKK